LGWFFCFGEVLEKKKLGEIPVKKFIIVLI